MYGHHSFIYPIPINIFNTLNAEYEVEQSIYGCVCAVFENISFYYNSEHNPLYLETALCFRTIRPPLGHQYSILKEDKML